MCFSFLPFLLAGRACVQEAEVAPEDLFVGSYLTRDYDPQEAATPSGYICGCRLHFAQPRLVFFVPFLQKLTLLVPCCVPPLRSLQPCEPA